MIYKFKLYMHFFFNFIQYILILNCEVINKKELLIVTLLITYLYYKYFKGQNYMDYENIFYNIQSVNLIKY